MTSITLIDTSVLCELLRVPGKSDVMRSRELRSEMDRRVAAGERLVIPITTIIETGNHIAQCSGQRYGLARGLIKLLQTAASEESPWRVLETPFDAEFLRSLCDGDSTGQDLAQLAAEKIGAGDVAVLVERDHLKRRSSAQVQVWTLDAGLHAKAAVAP